MTRQRLVVGNWKMNGSGDSVAALMSGIVPAVTSATTQVAVCPVALHLPLALSLAGEAVTVGAQNCSEHEAGAYTGEIAADMLADIGCRWVILGHSERRQYYGETDALVASKAASVRAAGLTPILCVGETLAEREQGDAVAVVTRQLQALGEAGLRDDDVVAYEPVWAIGTGQTATPEQAQEMHAAIRRCLQDYLGERAGSVRLLYGGSVKAGNAAELFAQPDIDGGLVGGASLQVDEFVAIATAP